jgi:uncharacterized membrane protein YkvA (DUF1232 family)
VSGWLLAALFMVATYLAGLAALLVAGRGSDARAVARLVPDCLRLARRLARDPRVSRARRLSLLALVAYLALPFDLVPDFIPVLGALDDALIVVLVLRGVARAAGSELLVEHWPGPARGLELLQRALGKVGTARQPG